MYPEYPPQTNFISPFCKWLFIAVAVYVLSNHGMLLGTDHQKSDGGGLGGGGKDRKKIMQERVTKKIIVQRRQIKKVLQSELHCRAYKLYPTKRHPGMQPLYTVVLVLVESPFTWFSIQSGKRTFFPGKVNTFSVQQPHHVQWQLNTLVDNRGLKKTLCGINSHSA